MIYFTVDLFIDALILVLHANTSDVRDVINKVLSIYEEESKEASFMDNDLFAVYIKLIREVMGLNLNPGNEQEMESFLLKIKSSPEITKDPEFYTTLKKIFTDQSEFTPSRYQYLIKKLHNAVLWYANTRCIKRMFGCLANNGPTVSAEKQDEAIRKLKDICAEVIKNIDDQQNKFELQDETTAKTVDFTNKETILKALKVHRNTTVTNRFITGLQGLNKALNGGFYLGSSMVFNSLSGQGKCLRNGTPVKIPGGWRNIEELHAGEYVTAVDGTPTKILGVFPHSDKLIYRLTFRDGRWIDASDDHIWHVKINRRKGSELTQEADITTARLASMLRTRRYIGLYIPLCESERGPDKIFKLSPNAYGRILMDSLRGPDNARIHPRYLNANHRQRLSLFKGLLGLTDHEEIIQVTFSFPVDTKELAEDILLLVRSLGWTGKINRISNVDGQPTDAVYTVIGTVEDRNRWLKIESVVPLPGKADCTCIAVDHPSKLYVTKDYIVTHNTLMMLKMARWQITLNRASSEFKNPTCLFYSLENETPQNTMQLFREMYINLYREVPPASLTDEQIVELCYDNFNKMGWRLVVDRKLGAEFGFAEFVANFTMYVNSGYTPLMCCIDYMNMLKKGSSLDDGVGNHLLLRENYTNVCNFLKSRNCTFVTAHQLNRRAAEVVRLNPAGAVKKFGIDMLADGMDPQREIDIAFYQHKEVDTTGRAFMTWKEDKNRYDPNIPEKYKYFAYQFLGDLGILDDVGGEDMSTDNIYAVPYDNDDDIGMEMDDSGLMEAPVVGTTSMLQVAKQ